MREHLFGELYVERPAYRTRWWIAALSLAGHVAVMTTVLMIPLLAVGALPELRNAVTFVTPAGPPDVPPPPVARRVRSTPQPVVSSGPPIVIPDVIGPEPGFVPEPGDLSVYDGFAGGSVIDLPVTQPEPPPSPVVAPRAPVRLHSGITPPAKVVHVPPVYPSVARQAQIEGIVIIEAIIGTDGRVAEAHILRSVALLDEAALAAVREWVFTPARLNGDAIAVVITVTVNFTLQK